jgi:phosphoenolpyruvate phosphomutase
MMKKQVIVSAGDAITAKLIEEAGFDGIWISGFEASARLGLADNGSITMTEMLNIAKPIVDAVNIPVWVDVDTGYNNFARTVREFEKIGVSDICIEDNIPELKQNSLWGDKIPLMNAEAFGIKIKVPHKLKIIARTEAIIRDFGIAEAKKRLAYYYENGADILLPHTRDANFILKDILNQITSEGIIEIPLAIVPTKFPYITNQQLFNMGYSMVIWANQTERSKIKATRECLGSLKASDCAEYIEAHLSATLDDMKGLMPND